MLGKQHHIAVISSNWDAAREFYVNKLGFELIRECGWITSFLGKKE